MYLRTGEEFAQKETWSAPQALNRVMVEPVSIGYLGNFHEHLASPAEQTCGYHYSVANFRANSFGLPLDMLKNIQKVANDIVGKVKHKLKLLGIKKEGKKADVYLNIDFQAHLDKKTDTAKLMWSWGKNHRPPLYQRRGIVVRDDLVSRIEQGLENLRDRFNFSYEINYTYSPQGGGHPVSSKNPGENRRVEVCVRNLAVKKKK